MRPVIIFTEGGVSCGLGHLARTMALYDACEKRGHPVRFVANADEAGRAFLGQREVEIANWYEAPASYGISQDSYCIVDSYRVTEAGLEEVAAAAKRVLCFDDTNRLGYPRGLVLNAALYAGEIGYPPREGVKYLLGSAYTIVRAAFRENFLRQTQQVVKNILVMMGGADVCNVTMAAIESAYAVNSVEIHVVIGPAFRDVAAIAREIAALPNPSRVHTYENITEEELSSLMRRCDLAITAAGQTSFEMMATKLPFVGVQVADNQAENVKGLLAHGVMRQAVLVDREMSTAEKRRRISAALWEVLPVEERQSLATTMQKLKLSDGVNSVLNELLW